MLASTKVKMSGCEKKMVNRNTYNISSVKRVIRKFMEVSTSYVLRSFFFLLLFFRTVQSSKRYPFISFTGSKHPLNSQRYFLSRLVTVFRPVSDRKRNEKDPAGDL